MLNHVHEGPVACGQEYHKRMLVELRLEELGPEVILAEVKDLFNEIMIRTDVLATPPLKIKGK